MNQTQTRSLRKKVLSLILAVVMAVSLLPISAFASGDSKASTTATTSDGYEYNIMFLDCGRKYYSVDSIKQIIDNASAAGFNYIQLAVGNDGLRFLLDDMSLTVNGVTYSTAEVTEAIQNGNTAYNKTFDNRATEDTNATCKYNPEKNELTQNEMDEIITYAASKGMGVIPCVNTPGHMDAILSAANSLTGTTCSYNGSARTIDVTNNTAVAFTQALLQKYIDYFAGKGCKLFNMGADEYANDIYDSGSMGFGNLQSTGKYSYYVQYVNAVAEMIGNAGMKPMAFNDGIYFNNNTSSGTFNKDIIICYWSSGWSSYKPMPASELAGKGFKLINTNGDYYWVLGKTAKCDAAKAGGFDKTAFPGGTVDNPVGSMFCIWADYPGAETEASVISKTADTIAAFGKTLPQIGIKSSGGTALTLNGSTKLTVPGNAEATWTVEPAGVIELQSSGNADERSAITGTSVVAKAVGAGTAKVTATVDDKTTYTTTLTVTDPSTVDVTVTVNGTHTETVKDVDLRNQIGTYDQTIAKVSVDCKKVNGESTETKVTTVKTGEKYYIKNSNGQYLSSDANWSDVNSAAQWTWDGSYLKNGSNYLHYSYSYYGWTTTTARRWATELYFNNGTFYGSKWSNTYSDPLGSPVTRQTTDPVDESTITFRGVAVGTTSVKIGDVTYKIHVVAEDPSKVTPLKLEYWITNAPIASVTGADSESRDKVLKSETYKVYFTNIAAKADGVASPDGVDVTTIAPANTSHDNRTVYYWRCRMLDTTLANNSTSTTQRQTADGGDDETMSGVGFTKIRYYGSSWQVFTENNEWVTVDTEKNQLIAYYLEYIKVSDEVESFAADWGNRGDGSKGGWLDTDNYCTLSMQVVYEDGTTNPTNTTASALKSKTIVYGYWDDKNGRGIGTIMLDGQEYEIYKVTSKTGAATASFSGYDATVTNFDWDDNERTVWEGDASSSVSIHNDATGFSTEGANANLCWDENKEAILLRVYVRAKVTEDSLTVNYYDESNTTLPFYSYNIAVASGTTFNNDFAYSNGRLINNTVTNIKNVTQTVNWKLEEMSEIGAQYRYGNYTFTNANKETGNKVVNLYYKFKTEKTFVVDFGLPLHIEKTDINPALASANITEVAVGKSLYATINANADYSIDYILNKTIDGSDRVTVTYSGTNKDTGKDDSATYNLTVIPATSVYYEDSFATFTNANGTKNVAQGDNAAKGIWTKVTDGTTQTSVNQALEALGGTTNTKNVYGYDQAYANSSKFSMGSATKVTVDANTANNGQWPTATFTFKGTGFDVISLTDNNSGAISVKVYSVGNDGTETQVKGTLVNNYYGYTCKDGKWTTTPSGDNNALYQIPVIKISGLDYGTYKVVITASYATFADKTGDGQYNFWLDAIRVYDPMGKDNATYEQDNEGYPQYIKLRDSLVGETATAKNGSVFIDGAADANITTYANYGPNNEVYLANGQAITFTIPENTNIASIQIGAKAPNGNAAEMNVNGTKTAIPSATEMYYQIATQGNQSFTVTNTGNGLLSLTNLKITFKTNPNTTVTLAALSDEDQANAVAQVRALFAAPAEPFNPDLFTASWGHSARKGDTATLTVKTSEDVEAIEVDGQMIDKYVTRTERTGWGWWAKTVTFREFTYTDTATVTKDYTVCAVNGKGVSSDAITATLTVRPSVRDWLHGIFGKWF